jgi:Tfp pilus assembly protein PilO
MKKSIGSSGPTIIVAVAIIFLAGAFWLLLLQPKREKSSELSKQEASIQSEVVAQQATVSAGEAAKAQFPDVYRQLVVLGKAVPAEADTSSLLVQLDGLSAGVHTSFRSISSGGGEEAGAVGAETAEPSALAPLGAVPGPSGLLAMPYSLEFEGGFFDLTRFLRKLDALVVTDGNEVSANGRLVMVDGFNLTPLSTNEESTTGGTLSASLQVNTYVTPPGQGVTAGATATGPAEEASPELTEIAPEATTEE